MKIQTPSGPIWGSEVDARIIELLESIESTLQNPPRDQHERMMDALSAVQLSNDRVVEALQNVARQLRERR